MTTPKPGFTTAPVVPAALSRPLASYLAAHPTLDGLATGALVFWPAASSVAGALTPPRILLLQRAPHDSMPLRWETPGGAADAEDASIAAAAARELREEAGLAARAVRGVVGDGFAFRTRAGRRLRKVSFVVEVEAPADRAEPPVVRLDPDEHVAFVWASEAECRAGRMAASHGDTGGTAIPFTHADQEAVVLAGFRVWEHLVREGAEEAAKRLG